MSNVNKIIDELKTEIESNNKSYLNMGYRNAAYDFSSAVKILFTHVDDIDKDTIREFAFWIIECGEKGKVDNLSEFIEECNKRNDRFESNYR